MAPRNEERRNEILKAAFDQISTQPFNKVTFSSIAAQADIKRSLLQHYFGHKNDLMKAMLDEILKTAFAYMDSLSFEKAGEDPFQKISDFDMLFFKAVSENLRFHDFIYATVSEADLLDDWIDSICTWLWTFLPHDTYTQLQIRTSLVFAMGGSMHLFLHEDELGITYQYFCRKHMEAILHLLDYDHESVKKICDLTDERIGSLSGTKFLKYCQKNIPWMNL
jgi:AcrR family transcriptional regulator